MNNRKLIAALACRVGGSRLYGKPIQNLGAKYTILEYLIDCIKGVPEISEIVLGISEFVENLIFQDIARKKQVAYIVGDEKDVLKRLILCGRSAKATDVFRITTECPFVAWEFVQAAWNIHLQNDNDITVVDYLPEGINFEIYKLSALELSHRMGSDAERSEFCSAFARRCPELFKVAVLKPPTALCRLDLRFTVDYPEDLVLCRRAYAALADLGPHIPVRNIIEFADANPALCELVSRYVDQKPIWGAAVNANLIVPLNTDEKIYV